MTTINEMAAEQLAGSPDYRVLRRVPPVEQWQLGVGCDVVRAVVVDCETTGLGDDDRVIELAILPFDYDRVTGQVTAIHFGQALSAFQDPGKPIPTESIDVHGITDEMVAGHSITNERVAEALGDAKLIIAHHAAYDRGMVERQWPVFGTVAWGCSCDDIEWRRNGFESRGLKALLMEMGWFFDGHRALNDAEATLFALTKTLPKTGQTALGALLAEIRKPQYLLRVEGSVIDEKDLMKVRGYRWVPAEGRRAKAWVCLTREPEAEASWVRATLTPTSDSKLAVLRVPMRMRYSRAVYELTVAA